MRPSIVRALVLAVILVTVACQTVDRPQFDHDLSVPLSMCVATDPGWPCCDTIAPPALDPTGPCQAGQRCSEYMFEGLRCVCDNGTWSCQGGGFHPHSDMAPLTD